MKSIFNGSGYFLNDDRASGGKKVEDDIVGCNHCHKPIKKTDWKMKGGFCTVCDRPLCHSCVERTHRFGCEGPEVLRLERALTELHRREQNAKLLGI